VKFSYLLVFVRNMERSLAFYSGLLDLEIAYRTTEADGTEVAFLVEPGEIPMKEKAMIELVTVAAGEELRPSGFLIGLEVASLAPKSALLEEHGYQRVKGPYSPDEGYLISEFKGPDGEDVGLMEKSVEWSETVRRNG